MADKDKTLATFRIDPSKWDAFKAQATEDGSNASAVLTEFLEWYLAGNRIGNAPPKSPNLDNLDNLDKKIDERIEARLNELRSQMEDLQGKLTA